MNEARPEYKRGRAVFAMTSRALHGAKESKRATAYYRLPDLFEFYDFYAAYSLTAGISAAAFAMG